MGCLWIKYIIRGVTKFNAYKTTLLSMENPATFFCLVLTLTLDTFSKWSVPWCWQAEKPQTPFWLELNRFSAERGNECTGSSLRGDCKHGSRVTVGVTRKRLPSYSPRKGIKDIGILLVLYKWYNPDQDAKHILNQSMNQSINQRATKRLYNTMTIMADAWYLYSHMRNLYRLFSSLHYPFPVSFRDQKIYFIYEET